MAQRQRGRGERLDRHQRRLGLEREGRRDRALAERLEGRWRQRVRLVAGGPGEAERDRQEHVAGRADRGREIGVGIVVREPVERLAQGAVARRARRGMRRLAQLRRDRLFGLGEQHVEHDELRARPFKRRTASAKRWRLKRPAAERVEALVVDHDDGDGRRRRLHAADAEAQIERCGLERRAARSRRRGWRRRG